MALKAWLRQRSGGPLPMAGGYLEQPAWMVQAFAIMDEAAHRLDEGRRQREAAERGRK